MTHLLMMLQLSNRINLHQKTIRQTNLHQKIIRQTNLHQKIIRQTNLHQKMIQQIKQTNQITKNNQPDLT